jgi:hypothetical protein
MGFGCVDFSSEFFARFRGFYGFVTELADGLNGKPGHFNFFPKTRTFLTFKDKSLLKILERSLK